MNECWKSMLAEGLSIRETARRCGVAPSTIKRRAERENVDLGPSRKAETAAKSERIRLASRIRSERMARERLMRLEAVKARIGEGRGVMATARDMGVGPRTIYEDMKRLGIRNSRAARPQSIAERVADMKPAEAVEYLIAAYDDLAGAMRGIEAEGFDLGLTHAETRVFGMLRRHEGEIVSHHSLTTLMDAHGDGENLQASNLCKVYVSKIRGKLRGTAYRIENVWGCGYRLIVSEDSEGAESAWPPPGSFRAGAFLRFKWLKFRFSFRP